jgi:uncharacterized membrane protein YgcG
MAYCPQCNREQRCGCERCHICGGELIERRAAPAGEPGRATSHVGVERRRELPSHELPQETSTAARQEAKTPGPTPANRTRAVLATLLLVLGGGILLIALFEAVNNAVNFPGAGVAPTVLEGLKRLGYYLGNLLYTSSVRVLTGFALVSTGLLLSPEGPIVDHRLARRIRLGVGLTMGGIALLCFFASLLLVIPLGDGNLLLKNLLPSLWAAVCIIMVMGAALLYGCYLLVFNANPGDFSRSAAGGRESGESFSFHGGLAAGGGGADRDTGGAETGPKAGRLAGTRRSAVKSQESSVSGSKGDTE